jgi:hypothetical protein
MRMIKRNATTKKSFDLSDHINMEHEKIDFFEKKDYSGLINLSSNQLEHPGLIKLFQGFIKTFDDKLVCQYLFLKSITDEACQFYLKEFYQPLWFHDFTNA